MEDLSLLKFRTAPRMAVLALLTMGAGAPRAAAQSNMADASLEELMSVEVTSVSRKRQPLTRSAAAVYVVTEDDIRRSGAASVPELLRMVPGLHVARIDAGNYAISARGFSGRFANKMLVLIDGRTVYTALFSGVYWDQNDVMVEDIERIEVTRGPGGAMWGANAVNGVINIITKSAKRSVGNLVSAGSGTVDPAQVAVRHGGQIGDSFYYRIFGKGFERGSALSTGTDRLRSGRGGARVDWSLGARDTLTIQGDRYETRSGQAVARSFLSPQRTFVEDPVSGRGGFAMARWERVYSERSDLAVQGYYHRETRFEGMAGARTGVADLDIQHRLSLTRRHELLWGGGARYLWDDIEGGRLHPASPLLPPRRQDALWSAFAQDEFALVPNVLTLSAGAKFQHNGYTGFEVQPTVRALWTPSKRTTFWGAVSRAVRTPSRRDHDAYVLQPLPPPLPAGSILVLEGSRHFDSEKLISYEGGWRWQKGARLSLDVAGFVGRYSDVQGVAFGSPRIGPGGRFELPVGFNNERRARNAGVEVSSQFELRRNLRLLTNYSYHHFSEDEVLLALRRTEYPAHQGQMRASWTVGRRWSIDLTAYAVSRLGGAGIPGYLRADARVAWKFGEGSELSAGVENMQRDRHREFDPEDYIGAGDARRAVYVRVRWGR